MRPKLTRKVAGLLAGITISMSLCQTTALADGQISYTGTRAALGSPLIDTGFTQEKWDSWEMLCFGVFLSNFCEPFIDDYYSAFSSSATTGSKGKGLSALQFSTGGDSEADAYLQDMLKYCINSQSQNVRSVNVTYNVYEYGEKQDGFNLGTRRAYFDDLIPSLSKYSSGGNQQINPVSEIKFPGAYYQTVNYKSESEFISSHSANFQEGGTQAGILRSALVPQFFVGNSSNIQTLDQVQSGDQTGATVDNTQNNATTTGGQSNNNVIFDLGESWDCQILTALIAKSFNDTTANSIVDSTEETQATESGLSAYLGRQYPLYMDSFGNICISKDGRYVIVIPASANCHITKDRAYNFVNSLIMNNFILTEQEMKIVSDIALSGAGTNGIAFGGAPIGEDSTVSKGKIVAYFSTESNLLNYTYQQARKSVANADRDTTLGDQELDKEVPYKYSDVTEVELTGENGTYSAGENFYKLLSDNVLYNQPVHITVTGIKSSTWETKGMWWWKQERESTEREVGDVIAVLTMLGNMAESTIGDKKNALTTISQFNASSNFEDTLQNVFDLNSSYYLLPHPEVSSSYRLYFNYACQLLTKVKSLSSSSLSFNADTEIDKIRNTVDARDLQMRLLVAPQQSLSDVNTFEIYDHSLELGNSVYGANGSDTDFYINSMWASFLDSFYEDSPTKKPWSTVHDFMTATSQVRDVKSGYKTYFKDNTYFQDTNSLPDDFYTSGTHLSAIRVLKPAAYFNVASQVFGVDEGVQFNLYTPQIYVSYLDFYGLLDSDKKSNRFNEAIFKGSDFLQFKADNFEYAKSEEEREAEVKLNVYKLLSLDKAGDKYRAEWYDRILRTLFVAPFDKSLTTENSIIGEKTKLLSLESAKNNALTGAILNNWDNIGITIFIILTVVAILSGLLNRRSFTWHLAILLTIAGTVMIIPQYLEISPLLCNRFINSTFKEGSVYWVLAESIRSNQQEEQVNALQTDDAKVQALLRQLNFLDTDSTMMVKLDISRKVIDSIAIGEETQSAIQRTPSLRWLLPVMMEQISQEGGGYDYVSIPVTQLYNNWANIYLKYKDTKYKPSTYKKPSDGVDYGAQRASSLAVPQKQETRFEAYVDCSAEGTAVEDTYKSITRINNDEKLVHTQFYLIDDYFAPSPYTETRGGGTSLSMKDWFNMAKKVPEIYGGGESNSLLERWRSTGSSVPGEPQLGLQHDITQYNRYESFINQSFGYFYTTEGLGTYFYTLLKDTFQEGDGAGKTPANILLNLQGTVGTTEDGREVRKTFMHQGNTGYLRDFLDLQEVFTNVVPYMYQMQTLACGNSETKGLLGKEKMKDSPFYSDNYASWAFRCNWVTKIYEDALYGTSQNITYKDADGTVKSYNLKNISDPHSYPSDRPMVFSEAQMYAQNLTKEDLTITELKCIKLAEDVEKRWTTLINYSTLDNLDSEVLYRIMAMESWIAFNQTFTNDNFFVSAKTLYPNSYDLRDISFITLFRSMLSQMTGSATYMNTLTVADQLYTDFGLGIMWLIQFLAFCLRQVFPFAREIFLMLQLVLSIITVLLNVTSPSKSRIKAALGWGITTLMFSGVTIFYYWVVSWSVRNPTLDTLVNTHKIFGSFGAGFSLVGWSLLLIILTAAYGVFVVYFNYCIIRGKHGLSLKDGAFGFYYTVSNKMFGALGDKLQQGFERATGHGGGVQSTMEESKKPIKTTVENDASHPARTKVEDGTIGTSPTGHEYVERSKQNASGPNISAQDVEGEVVHHNSKEVTKELNEAIERAKNAKTDE